MNTMSKQDFAQVMELCAYVYDVTLTPERLAVYWRQLGNLPERVLRDALDAHQRDPDRGRWFPKPADIFHQIQVGKFDGRPGPDEAWAIAVNAIDEAETVVWTDEIANAWGVAQQIIAMTGDMVGARMAFREAYTRLLQMVREAGIPARWSVSIGHDKTRRLDAVQRALDRGLLTHDQAAKYLPPPEPTGDGVAIAGLIAGNVTHIPESRKTRARLANLREMLTKKKGYVDRTRKEREARMQALREDENRRRREIEAQTRQINDEEIGHAAKKNNTRR